MRSAGMLALLCFLLCVRIFFLFRNIQFNDSSYFSVKKIKLFYIRLTKGSNAKLYIKYTYVISNIQVNIKKKILFIQIHIT